MKRRRWVGAAPYARERETLSVLLDCTRVPGASRNSRPCSRADGDRVVAFRATCSHCGVTASLSADILAPEVRYGIML